MSIAFASFGDRIFDIILRKSFPLDLSTPISEARYVVLDTELTGLDMKKDSIISVGAVRMRGGRIALGEQFYRLVSPSSALKHDSVVVHGITPDELEDKPLIGTVLHELADFCRDDVLVGHFISLDMNFINREMKTGLGMTMRNRAVDTYRIHEWMRAHDGSFQRHYGGFSEDLNLFALAKKYGIPVSGAHNAVNDAFMTAQLFQRFLSFLPGLGVRTLKDLLRVGKP